MNTLLNTNENVPNTLSKPTRVSKYYNEEDQQAYVKAMLRLGRRAKPNGLSL